MITDIEQAKEIVISYIESNEIVLTALLESSKGIYYRPWYVAALEIYNQYEQLIKADIATFKYDKNAVIGLLETQSKFDSQDELVISPWLTSELLIKVANDSIGLNIY